MLMRTEFENEQTHTTQDYSSKRLYALEKSGQKPGEVAGQCKQDTETDLPMENLKPNKSFLGLMPRSEL